MTFELISQDIQRLIPKRYLHDVTIDRYLYRHSEAHIVVDWDESLLEGAKKIENKRTANLGASMLGASVQLAWRGKDLQENTICFQGFVTGVSAQHHATRSYLHLQCLSYSKRSDQLTRYRVWQNCTLHDICSHIVKGGVFEIRPDAQSVLNGITIDLSVQFDETDFTYLSRMLHAWGIPMTIDDRANKIFIGSPSTPASGPFPALDWHWETVSMEGALVVVNDKAHATLDGPAGEARKEVNQFNEKLKREAGAYFPKLDEDHYDDCEWIADRTFESSFYANSAVCKAKWNGYLYDYSPGAVVDFGEQRYMVREAHIRGGPDAHTLTQEFTLQDYLVPLQLHQRRVNWPTRMHWAYITKNNSEDPARQGRVQVEFEWEKLDNTGNADRRCWLPTLTPYAGQKGTNGTSGFLSLPEVGERVLVQFLGDWDSDAVVVGSVREYPRKGFIYDPEDTKRWQTPSGNQITLTSRQDGSEIVRIKCTDKLIFEGLISGGKQAVVLDLFGSSNDRIHFEQGAGPNRLDIFCGGEIYMHADQKLLLEGGMVQIKATGGMVNIDGSPMVMINCGPWSLQPLQLPADNAKESSGAVQKKRAKPPAWTGRATGSSKQQSKEKHFIEFIAKEKGTGKPIPGERYRVQLPNGALREGVTDANGRIRIENIPQGQCKLMFPNMDADTWQDI